MERGSNSGSTNKADKQKGKKLGSKIEPFVPQGDHNARDLRSWAKRTGFVSIFSGEVGTSNRHGVDLERGAGADGSVSPEIEIDPVPGRIGNQRFEICPNSNRNRGANESDPILSERHEGDKRNDVSASSGGDPVMEHSKKENEHIINKEMIDVKYPGGGGEFVDGEQNQPELKCGIRDNPGLGLFS
ncbi:hypothetical protein E3N88_12150 [Mikania micrantha]|uniref:Uncharacterized protein n=1 Tax=Mikania micrantha TaxID=192012 RepID=A0A5N6P6G4_9ASTR|nr:hypothetical protein E3N88_12150 [Mikania micrantha]